MTWLAYCENGQCDKRFECYRYMCPDECRASLDVGRQCSPVNNYKHIYPIGDKPVREVKEELTESSKENNQTTKGENI